MSFEKLHGAWRIEEAPRRRDRNHPYGFPNTHWLVLGDRVAVIDEQPPHPLTFDFRIRVDKSRQPNEITIGGKHGGIGYCQVDEDLLFVAIGVDGVRPPRFANDCGLFFAMTRDLAFDLPENPQWPRGDILSDSLGRLVWDNRQPEYMGRWQGVVSLPGQPQCEVWASDYLVPLGRFLPTVELVHLWLQSHLPEVKAVCSERVKDWIEDDEELSLMSNEQIADTISIDIIDADNGEVHLWASTSIPIDHSIRVHLDVGIENETVRATGASIEG